MRQNIVLGFLACSLIMNAFLAGYIISGETRRPHHMPHGPLNRMEDAARDLDPKYQEQVLKLIKEDQSNFGKKMQEMGQSFQEIHTILTADTFDTKKLKDLQAKLAKRDDTIKDGMVTLFTEIAKTLPDKERIEFFRQMSPGPHGSRGGPPPPDEPFDEK